MDVLEDIVFQALARAQATGTGPDLPMDRATPLLGEGQVLDSLQAVSLIVAVEKRAQALSGHAVALTSEDALSRAQSPFLTLGTLADYVDELLALAPVTPPDR